MNAGVRLAWEEMWARGHHFVWSAALVAAAVALLTATELVSRAREAAVASRIDYLGPSLRLVPAGVTSTELARFEIGDRAMPERTVSVLRDELSPWLRAIEGRLLLMRLVDTVDAPVIGIPLGGGVGSVINVDLIGPTEILLGSDLARRLGKGSGDRVNLLGGSWLVARVLPALGSAEDLALFMQLSTLQEKSGAGRSVNEIRLYPKPGSPTVEGAALLRANHPELNVVTNADRSNVAERQTAATLREHRNALYWLTALAVSIGLITAAYINARERRVEMALLVTMGGTTTAVLVALVARATTVGLVGAAVGYALGAGIAIAHDAGATVTMAWSLGQPAAVAIAAALLSTAAAIPVSIHATCQDHVRTLQE